MSARKNNRWTPERLAQCQRLFEDGASNAALGVLFDVKPGTIASMAWQREWRRKPLAEKPTRLAGAERPLPVVDINPPIPPDREEIAFNSRLRRTIAAYWRARGKEIALQVETMGVGIQCIRSRSINGLPSDR